ncbi:MAG: hypothetical protein ACI85F_001980, partial [Bacteroidia bacterium]
MSIFEFVEKSPDEHSFRIDFKQKREQSELDCAKCGEQKLYWLSTLYQWKCS